MRLKTRAAPRPLSVSGKSHRTDANHLIDLALERAFIYRENAPSEVVDMPSDMLDQEKEARFAMLEKLADYDDELMEQLLSDIEPPRDHRGRDVDARTRTHAGSLDFRGTSACTRISWRK